MWPKRNLKLKYEVLQVSHCQHQCHYCYLSAASSINKTAEAYSKVNSMLFNHLSNYHYLLTNKKLLKFSIFMLLPYLGLFLWLIIFCRGCMRTFKLPEKASLSWVPKSWQVKKLLRVFHHCRVYSLFLAKSEMLSLSFSLLSSFGSLQSSSNTPHITLSEFGLEVIFA